MTLEGALDFDGNVSSVQVAVFATFLLTHALLLLLVVAGHLGAIAKRAMTLMAVLLAVTAGGVLVA